MKWIMLAVTTFLFAGAASAADAPSCDAKTSPIANQAAAAATCPAICAKAGYGEWNKQWTNTPPSGAGPVCGCVVKSNDARTGPIANQTDANNRCPAVCSAAQGTWNGQWTNTPPAGGGPVCGCYAAKAEDVSTSPIANQQAASTQCPAVCAAAKASWNGQWTNTPPSGKGPVCGCLKAACGEGSAAQGGGTPPPPAAGKGAYYTLTAKHSGKVLNVSGGSKEDGAKIIQWTNEGTDNSKWELQPTPDGFVTLVAKHSGKVLNVSGGSKEDGAKIIQWTKAGTDNEKWKIISTPDGYSTLISKSSGKVLNVGGNSKDNGAELIQWKPAGSDNEKWKIEKAP